MNICWIYVKMLDWMLRLTREVSFEPVKGKYVCEIKSFGRRTGIDSDTGETKFDYYQLEVQEEQYIDGDAAPKRYFRKKYYNTDTEYKTKKQSYEKMFSDIATIGIPVKVTKMEKGIVPDLVNDELFNASLIKANGMKCNVSANIYNEKQTVFFVKEFKPKKKANNPLAGIKKDTEVPF